MPQPPSDCARPSPNLAMAAKVKTAVRSLNAAEIGALKKENERLLAFEQSLLRRAQELGEREEKVGEEVGRLRAQLEELQVGVAAPDNSEADDLRKKRKEEQEANVRRKEKEKAEKAALEEEMAGRKKRKRDKSKAEAGKSTFDKHFDKKYNVGGINDLAKEKRDKKKPKRKE